MSKQNVEDIYPLSPTQQGMLFRLLFSDEKGQVYFDQYVATLVGALDVAAWRQAWTRVLERHAVLRTQFLWERREQPLQIVRRDAALPWTELDWRHLPEAERESKVAAFLCHDHDLGFDLGKPPLTRIAVIRLRDDAYQFVWSFHHLVCDGWSLGLTLADAFAHYKAATEGSELRLEAPRKFRDYITWIQGKDPAGAESYWRRTLAGYSTATPLPFEGTGAGGDPTGWLAREEQVRLPVDLSSALRSFARRHQLTLNTLMQGAWGLLLSLSSGEPDVVFGGIVSGRPAELEGVESMIGLFINLLPVRVQAGPDQTIVPWLKRLQEQQAEQREYEHSALDQIMGWSEVGRKGKLFESVVLFENYPVDALKEGSSSIGFEVHDVHLSEAGNFPLTLYVLPGHEQLALRVSYHWTRISAESARRILGHYVTLLRSLVANPEGRLGDLSIFSAEARAELLLAGRGADFAAPPATLHRLFEERAALQPDAVAVETTKGETLTYGELEARAEALGRHLRSLGAGPESIVALSVERSPEMIVGLLGILKAGAAYLPLDPNYPRKRVALMLEDSGARLLLTQERLVERLPVAAEGGVRGMRGVRTIRLDADWQVIEAGAAALPATAGGGAAAQNPAYIIYTSGSTGRPKGVLVPHAALVNYVRHAVREYGFGPADRVLQFASISFDTSAEEIYPCLVSGGTLVLRDDAMIGSLDGFVRELGARRITFIDLPTAYWHEMAAEMDLQKLDAPADLRLVIIGGEEALAERLAAWRRRVGERVRLVNTYGPTEATIVTTKADLTAPLGTEVPVRIGIGRAVSNARTYVLGRRGQLLPPGTDGELHLGGAGLARGYLDRPDLTAERFVPNPFAPHDGAQPGERLYRTGDLVRLLPDGSIEFRGRVDHQVKVRGFRIELGEIEAALRRLDGVRDAVAGLHGEGTEKRLVAWVVPQAETPVETGGLRAALKDSLPDYLVPSAFVLLEALPLSPSGKVDRKALPAPDSARPDVDASYAAPRNPMQEVLTEIWSELLGLERIGVEDDFFQLGGHSLLVAKLAARVRQVFGVELSLVEVFKKPTVAELAEAIERAAREDGGPVVPPIVRAPRDRPIPLSFPQERVWFIDQLSAGGNIAYNFQVTIWLAGQLDAAVLRRALGEIVRRHEVLRTSFPTIDGQPQQRIHPAGEIELPILDLRGVPASEREGLAERLFEATAETPFDVTRAPLIRWRLLRLDDELWELIQVEHHFVHDGWSFALLLQELKAIYPAFLRGEPSPLADPPIQYADFAHWQRSWLDGPVMDRLMDFWKRKLEGAPHGLEIATDRPRPARTSFAGDVELFRVPPDLYDGLRKFGRREGFTLYMTMLAGFFALLQRYTGETDMVIGTSNANRRTRELEGMLGMVVNSLLVRGDLSKNPSFRELLGRVRVLSLEVYGHQDMPFERLVQELKPERQLGRNPLFQIMYNFHDAAVPDLDFGGLEAKFLVRGNHSAKMDLNVIVIPRAEQRVGIANQGEEQLRALLHWEYNTDLFDRSTMLRMIEHYMTLLAGVVENAACRLSDLPLLTAAERQELLANFGSAASLPSADVLHGRFEAVAAGRPDAVAVTMGAQRLTYAELNRRANRLAHRLRALGVGPETPVPLCLGRSPDIAVGILGILKAGGAYVPIDPTYPAERIDWILEDSQVGVASPVLVTETSLVDSLPESRSVVLCLDDPDLARESEANPPEGAGAGNLAYVIYTSGSTGKPKGVPIRHSNVVRLFASTEGWFDFGPDDVWTLFHSFAFDFSVWELWGALLYGGRLVAVPYLMSRSPEAFLLELVRERVTVLNQTPSAFRQLIDAEEALRARGEAAEELALRYVVFGGEALDLVGLRPWFARHGDERPRLVNMYGITETTVHVTYRPVTREDAEAEGLGSRIGRPILDLSVHLLDADLNLVPMGVPGEIHVGGLGLSSGYLNRPDLAAERFIPDPFSGRAGERLYRSGDIARVRPSGDVEYVGRRDHQVKVRGFRIELGEIEAALTLHPALRETVVLASAGADGATRLVAYVVAPPATAPTPDELRTFLKASLPDYMVPAAFVVLEELPLTSHGKVDRKALPAPEAASGSTGASYVAPRNPIEETLARIWGEVLGVPRVGMADNFFTLGGHSLTATRILSRVRDTLAVDLSLVVIFETPTVEAMAAAVPAAVRTVPISSLALPQDDLLARAAELSDHDLDDLLVQMMATEGERA